MFVYKNIYRFYIKYFLIFFNRRKHKFLSYLIIIFLSEIKRFSLIENLLDLIRIFQKILIHIKKIFRFFHPFDCFLGNHLPFILFVFKFLLKNNFNKVSQNIVNYQFSIILCFKCGEKLINFDIEVLVDKVGENLSLVLRSPIPGCGLECQ